MLKRVFYTYASSLSEEVLRSLVCVLVDLLVITVLGSRALAWKGVRGLLRWGSRVWLGHLGGIALIAEATVVMSLISRGF